MEQFRTQISVTPRPFIDHTRRILTAGSCFADNIGQKLNENKFTALVNPLGVCYNPVSIHKSLMIAAPGDGLYVESQGTWRHFDFHSKFAEAEKTKVAERLAVKLKEVRSFEPDVIILTYGTAWVYKCQDQIVANCHKRPAAEFEKVLLTPDEIVGSFSDLFKKINKKFILTLSPVRHTRDTLELNQVSKAVLRVAIHEIQKKFPEVDYFPAYEIVIDDLRDYRFYEADMIHPSDVAIEYIWRKFHGRYFSQDTQELIARWEKVSKSLRHRAFHPSTEQHKEFLKRVVAELHELQKHIDVSKEIAMVREGLIGR